MTGDFVLIFQKQSMLSIKNLTTDTTVAYKVLIGKPK